MNRLLLTSAAILTCAAAAPAFAKPDRAFLDSAMKGDNSEVTLGRIGEQRAMRPAVRDFAHMLVTDHGEHFNKVADMAKAMGMTPTDAIMPEAAQEQRKLRRLSGRAFDREFVRYMINDHREDIREFKAQAAGTGPTARMASDTLPTLHHHLETAISLKRG